MPVHEVDHSVGAAPAEVFGVVNALQNRRAVARQFAAERG
jgi:hypothetical protein